MYSFIIYAVFFIFILAHLALHSFKTFSIKFIEVLK